MKRPISVLVPQDNEIDATPTYLFDYASLYREDARLAGASWFRDARYGLGIHFGLYSLLGRGERVLCEGGLKESEYRALTDLFTCARFDALELVEFAIASGMRYIRFTARGEDGFSLFNTSRSSFNSAASKARRDLLGELASACEYHGIGLCVQYSLGTDMNHEQGPRPGRDLTVADLERYREFVYGQLEELLTQYGSLAAICLEGADQVGSHALAEHFESENVIRYIHHIQPQVLVSLGQGLVGSEDFLCCGEDAPAEDAPELERGWIHRNTGKTLEYRLSMGGKAWGYHVESAGKHLREDGVWSQLAKVCKADGNLLVGTALMPDGSLDYEDVTTLVEVGKRIEDNGFPR